MRGPEEHGVVGAWIVEHAVGGAGELHQLEPPPGARRLWVLEPERPAVVLGSTQQVPGIEQRAAELGLEVVRRRSGGGAVVVRPGEQLWVDLVVPRGDPRWDDDVERAAWWVGEAWANLLAERGERGRIEVHRRGVTDRELGRLACFAALGPGEVAVDGRKVVGISQRRTRELARFQCVVHLRWDPSSLVEVLGVEPGGALHRVLAERAGSVPLDAPPRGRLVGALVRHLG